MNDRMKTTEPATEAALSGTVDGLLNKIKSGLMTQGELMSHAQHLEGIGESRAACNLYGLWLNSYKGKNKHISLFNYGGLLQTIGDFNGALGAYMECIQLSPEFPQAYINLGLLYEKSGNHPLALQSWLQLINRQDKSNPPEIEFLNFALNHIGRLQEDLKNYAQAERALEHSLALNPNQPGVIQHWVHIRQKACSWPIYKKLPGVSLDDMKRYTSPLAMLAYTEDPVEQLNCANSFCERTYTFKEERLCEGRVYSHKRVRVGYVSADFREHAVGFLLPSLVAGHEKAKYELFAYDFSKEEKTTLRLHLKETFDHFKSIEKLSDRQAAELIASDEIDILIDLHGLSSGTRPGIFALHPAPQQGAYLGFIGPTGMPWLDFVIADKWALPEELTPYFTEKPLYVEGSFLPMVSYIDTERVFTREDVGLSPDAFVMGAFSNTYKITPKMFDTWMRLLDKIPDSVLWLIDDNSESTENLKAHALTLGVGPERFVFSPRVGHLDFCARLKLADVYLDTYPYNCGSTSNDVIHAGVPMVTMYGKTFVSRMGLSLMTSLNSASHATRNYDEYVDKVIHLSIKKREGALPILIPHREPVGVGKALEQLVAQKIPKLKTQAPSSSNSSNVELFQICHTQESLKEVSKGFVALDNSDNSRSVWDDFLSIKNYLTSHSLQDDVFYGFLSNEFPRVTGVSAGRIRELVANHGQGHDVLILSPHWDLSGFFINALEQGDFFHPGLLASAQNFSLKSNENISLSSLVTHEDTSAFGNYFIAKKSFWLDWLDLSEKLYQYSEKSDDSLYEMLNQKSMSNYDMLPHKILIHERLVSLMLAGSMYKSKALNIFELPPSRSPLSQYKSEAIILNALKLAYCKQNNSIYLKEYHKIRERVWLESGIDKKENHRNWDGNLSITRQLNISSFVQRGVDAVKYFWINALNAGSKVLSSIEDLNSSIHEKIKTIISKK